MALSDAELRDLSEMPLPRHVAIIMDGNGRWAKQRGRPRIEGHREGAKSVREIVRTSRKLGIEAVTLFAFSEQNWDRPPDEVEALMELLYRYVLEERAEIVDIDIRLTAIGGLEHLPPFVRLPLSLLMKASAKNRRMTLCLALSYGAREDIVRAARRIAARVTAQELAVDQIDEQTLEQELSTADLPPVDLMIRTSGEQRLSNFLLWEMAYAELMFVPDMWPDFRAEQLATALRTFSTRERRFGLTSEQLG